jgi:hypothetical protein
MADTYDLDALAAMEAAAEIESLRECLEYDPKTGRLTWKERPRSHFGSDRNWKSWNKRYAHTVAGSKNRGGYQLVTLNNRHHKSHRVAWALHYGGWPQHTIDHLNRDKSDDRISNLRDVEHHINHRNMPTQPNNTSGFPGVYYDSGRGAWCAAIWVKGKDFFIGRFQTKAEAVAARMGAEKVAWADSPRVGANRPQQCEATA